MNLFNKKQSNIPRRRLAEHDMQTSASDVFRRNRTMTVATLNHSDGTNNKTDLESPRAHAHHLATKRRKVLNILILVLVSIALLWALVSHFTAAVTVSVSDVTISKSIDVSRYGKAIQDYLNVNPIGRLSFLLDQPALTAYVSSKLPEVENITQKNITSIGETNFIVTMRVPVAGWRINGKQYYVDLKGIPFEFNYFSEPTVQIVDNSGVSLQAGAAVVSNRLLSFVGRVVSLAKTSGYTVSQAILPADTTRELEVRLKDNNFLIKLSIDRPAGEQVEDMSRAVQYFISHGQTPDYIDVRVSGKAFYK